jgi:hypothetical protein
MKPWMCSKCRKKWSDPKPIFNHIRDAHGGDGKPVRVPKSERRQREDAEPSMADLAIQAHIDRAMGIPNDDDWLLG